MALRPTLSDPRDESPPSQEVRCQSAEDIRPHRIPPNPPLNLGRDSAFFVAAAVTLPDVGGSLLTAPTIPQFFGRAEAVLHAAERR